MLEVNENIIEIAKKKYGYCSLFADTDNLQDTIDDMVLLIGELTKKNGRAKIELLTGIWQIVNHYALRLAEKDIDIEKSKTKE